MNLAPFVRFHKARRTNRIWQIIQHVKSHPVFRRARIDLYSPTVDPDKLIVLLGQVHTVWKGKIDNSTRKKIVACQARLCSYYAYFEKAQGIKKFGGEGIYEGLTTNFQDRESFKLYQQEEKSLAIKKPVPVEKFASVSEKILSKLGGEWQQAMREQNDLKKIQTLAAAVSGQTLFNYLNEGRIEAYPIEGERAYQHVLEGINQLGERIRKLEETEEMRYVKQRGGKAKTEKEAEKVKQYNALVKAFNQLIGSDVRERATMEILKQKAQQETLVVFTMGIGHRKNYLKLDDEYLKGTRTAFLFITPPELRLNLWWLIGLPLLILGILLWLSW